MQRLPLKWHIMLNLSIILLYIFILELIEECSLAYINSLFFNLNKFLKEDVENF